jgi:hypothetical protein
MTMLDTDQDRDPERAVECAACGHQRAVHGDPGTKLCMGTAEPGQHEPLWKRCGCEEFVEPGPSLGHTPASRNP